MKPEDIKARRMTYIGNDTLQEVDPIGLVSKNQKSYPVTTPHSFEVGKEYVEGKDFWIDDEITVGSKVRCLFNDSGHKFWFSRGEVNKVLSVIHKRSGVPHKIVLEPAAHQKSDFYSNDFEIVEGERRQVAIPLPKEPDGETHWRIRHNDKVNSVLGAALRFLDEEQMICLRDCLIERTLKEPDEDELNQSVTAVIADNLYNIHNSKGHSIFDTEKCDEIAQIIVMDLNESFHITKK
jgi:hypothetical protein